MRWRLSDHSVVSVESSTRNISSCVLETCMYITNSSAFVFPIYIFKRLLRTLVAQRNWFCYCIYRNGGACGREAHERWVVGSCILPEGWVYILTWLETDSSPNACCETAKWFLFPEVRNSGEEDDTFPDLWKLMNVVLLSWRNGELLYRRLFLIIQHSLFSRSKQHNLRRLIKLC